MTTRNLTDDLLSIARASLPGEMPKRLRQVLLDPAVPREELSEKARYVIGLLLLQATGLEYWPPERLSAAEVRALGLAQPRRERRALAEELREDAKLLEDALITEGVLPRDEVRPESLHGLWKGVVISEEPKRKGRDAIAES